MSEAHHRTVGRGLRPGSTEGASLSIGMAAVGVLVGSIAGYFVIGTIGAVVAAALGGAVGYAVGARGR